MNLRNCCICLLKADTLKGLNSEDDNKTKLVTKLVHLAPEYEWLEIFTICLECCQQLDNAYSFKQLCFANESFRKQFIQHDDNDLSSYEDLKAETMSIAEENEADTIRTEYSSYECGDTTQKCNKNVLEKFICFHCHKKFKSKSVLERHISIKHENICTNCNITFSTKKGLATHRKTEHQKKPPIKFQCEVCGEHFSLLKNILEHSTIVHSMNRKDIKPYSCNQCNNKFASSTLLIQHKKYHNGDRTCICTTCGKAFITRRDLNGHEKLHDNKRKYSCDKCDKSFNTSQNLKTHIYVVHTDSSQWKYSCPVCSKRFAMKANCNEHIKRHEGNKNFVCHICKKTFVSNHEVKKHIKLHSNIAAFKCSHCPKHYRDRRSLDAHLSKKHGIGDIKPSLRVKKFVCHICPSQFFDNAKLQRHIRTHTGVKPFSCVECDKKFIDKSYLSHHLKSVHKIVGTVKKEESPGIIENYY